MGKIGFNCQRLLSEIELTTDFSHSTWFHKTVRFSQSKARSEEDLAQHVLFDTRTRRTRLGILTKIEESEPSQDDTDQPLLLTPKILPFSNQVKMIQINPFSYAKDLTISEGTRVTSFFHFHSRVLMCFHAPQKWTNSFS